ncbi:MAG TPA: GGDEF domain-containing protein [Burkholderiales bacterium]|nr:GGDEF domain-containing protein [Burkholderiales bacterium]
MSKADELRLLREAIKSFPDAVAVRSADAKLIACSDLYARLAAAAPEDAAEFQSADGRWLRRTLRRLDGGGSVELIADVTELRRAEQASRFLAYHDQLTGLPNRRLLDDRLRQAIRLAERRDRMVAALLVHLDDFRQVNDALGHDAGDALLREVAERLSGCVRKADTLARASADEFALVVCDLKDGGDCRVVAEKVLQALQPEFRVAGRRLRLGVSIGISLFPADGADGEALLRNADAATFRAKQLGRNQIRFFAPAG